MSRRWSRGPVWTVVGLAGLALLAWLLIGRGDGKADAVRQRTEADADAILTAAGFPWAHLKIDDAVGHLVGDAPSPAQRSAAYEAALAALRPMMGVPGVFARLEDGQTASASAASEPVVAAPVVTEECQVTLARTLGPLKIHFTLASVALTPDSAPLLERVRGWSAGCPQARLRVDGYSDAQGDAAANLRLSQRRAQAVVDALVQRGVAADHLQAQGHGEEDLLDSGDTPEAHERNRRIEFHVLPKTP